MAKKKSAPKKTVTTGHNFILRFESKAMFDKVVKKADAERRSVNQYLLTIIEARVK
jgi:predicted HicB family RNase H-like nuclease